MLERNSGFTEGLGRRLPSPDGSDQDISPYFAEGGSNPVLEAGEEPVDFYRLERTGKDFCLRDLWYFRFLLCLIDCNFFSENKWNLIQKLVGLLLLFHLSLYSLSVFEV